VLEAVAKPDSGGLALLRDAAEGRCGSPPAAITGCYEWRAR
jgi:hypothetical protein